MELTDARSIWAAVTAQCPALPSSHVVTFPGSGTSHLGTTLVYEHFSPKSLESPFQLVLWEPPLTIFNKGGEGCWAHGGLRGRQRGQGQHKQSLNRQSASEHAAGGFDRSVLMVFFQIIHFFCIFTSAFLKMLFTVLKQLKSYLLLHTRTHTHAHACMYTHTSLSPDYLQTRA